MNYKDFKKKLLRDPEFKKEYLKKDLRLEIAKMMIEARIVKGVTQEKLASLVKTKQPSIARIEKGNYLPSLNFLERIAKALGTYLIPPRFAFLEKEQTETLNIVTVIKYSNVLEEANRIINRSPSYNSSIEANQQ